MKIAMVGTGYVGLVSGVCFSDFGHDVICVDKDPAKIEMLEAGKVPIYEPGLDELMAKNVAAGRLSFTGDLAAAVAPVGILGVTVMGEPSKKAGAVVRASIPIQLAMPAMLLPPNCSAKFASNSLDCTCCSTIENCASCAAYAEESIGSSGS